MDETQKRKISAKEFIEKNRNIGFIVITIFVSLFTIYFASIYFYSFKKGEPTEQASSTPAETGGVQTFFESLLPVFEESERKEGELDDNFLSNFSNSNINNIGNVTEGGKDDITNEIKILKIEEKPVLGYSVFDRPVSIKTYIKNKPKICAEKLAVVLKKEEKSTAVLNFQNTLRNIESYEDTPISGILDQETRDKVYIFQKRYADILYKNNTNKEPTRLIDKETVHFLNLLCGFDKEEKGDFVQIPTLRYVLKETRQIFDYNTDTKESVEVSSKLASSTQEVLFSKSGDLAVFRKDNDGVIESTFYNIKTKSSVRLENNISTLDFNSKDLLIYGVPGENGLNIKSYQHAGNTVSRIASIPLNEWDLKVISDTEIALSSKPTSSADGIYMMLDLQTKNLRQVAGPYTGMALQKTNMSDYTILSLGGQGTLKTLLVNNKTRNIGEFGMNTFAEKCSQTIFANGIFCAVPKTLSANFTYPDDWYKGKVFTEDIIVFKTLSGTTAKVISYMDNRPYSITNLNVNKSGIFFIDENTLSLYSLEL